MGREIGPDRAGLPAVQVLLLPSITLEVSQLKPCLGGRGAQGQCWAVSTAQAPNSGELQGCAGSMQGSLTVHQERDLPTQGMMNVSIPAPCTFPLTADSFRSSLFIYI